MFGKNKRSTGPNTKHCKNDGPNDGPLNVTFLIHCTSSLSDDTLTVYKFLSPAKKIELLRGPSLGPVSPRLGPSYLQRIALGPVGSSFLQTINFVKCNLVIFSDDIPASDLT